MTIATIREKLHEYIEIADEEKIKAIYTLLEDRLKSPATSYDWSEDKDFVAELDDRVKRYDKGIDKGYTVEEVKAILADWKEDYKNARK